MVGTVGWAQWARFTFERDEPKRLTPQRRHEQNFGAPQQRGEVGRCRHNGEVLPRARMQPHGEQIGGLGPRRLHRQEGDMRELHREA